MPDAITLQTDTNLFGAEIAESAVIDREPLAQALYAQLKNITLEEFVSFLTNGFESVIDYANLCAGEKTGQRISLLFNPHRLDTGTKRFPISLYQALKDERFVRGLARVVLLNKKKGATKDLLYASIGMGVQGTSYVQEFPPHVARDLALEYGLSKSSRVLDPCAGWGGRMLGFSAVCDSYTACEPSARTFAGLIKIAAFIRSYRSEFVVELHEAPFEDVILPQAHFDFAFTSPPYYDTEHYAPGEQTNSFNRYPTFDAWRKGFYEPLVHRTMDALKPGAVFVINIGSRIYPLNDSLFKMSEGRYHVEKQKGKLSASNGLGKDGEGETFYEVRRDATYEVVTAATQLVSEEITNPSPAPSALDSILAFAASGQPETQSQPQTTVSAHANALGSASETSSELDAARAFLLELRGRAIFMFKRDGKLFTANASQLTAMDRVFIKAMRDQLLSLVLEPPAPPPVQVVPQVEPVAVRAHETLPALSLELLNASAQHVSPVADLKPPTDETPGGSLVQFLGNAPPQRNDNWKASAPPCLDGIDNIRLNVETAGLKWWEPENNYITGIAVGYGDRNHYLPIRHTGGNLDIDTVKRWAQTELRGKHITNINTKFDVHNMREWDIDLEEQGNTVSDVAHYAALLDDNRRKFNLDQLLMDFIGRIEVPRVDASALGGESRMAHYHASEVAMRAEYQVRAVEQLREKMWPMLDAQELQQVRQLEDDVIFPVCEMEKNGAPINVPLLKQWCAETEQKLDAVTRELSSELGFAFNPDSGPDWEKLFHHCDIPVTTFTSKGAPSFTDADLKLIDNRYVQMGRMAGKLASLRSKFFVAYDNAIGNDGLLRYELHQLRGDEYGTVRGRFSASNKNIQQVMNIDTHTEHFGGTDLFDYYVRKLFIAGPGKRFLEADANQIEFRIFVHQSGSARLLKAYEDDPTVSFHKIVGGIVLPFRPDMSYTGIKRTNFMKLYGGGVDKVAAVVGLPRAEAEKFVQIYNQQFPEIKDMLRLAENLAKARGFIRTVYKRRARFPDKKFAYKALNAAIQGSAADIMKLKLVALHKARKATDFLMRFTVHDAVGGDTSGDECTRKVTEILNEQSVPMKVLITWSVNTGENWAACK